MRIESSITSVSWIPSEAIHGLTRLPFDLGVGHYDDPPPAALGSLEQLHAAGAFRFANRLAAWIEVVDGTIVDHGQTGQSLLSRTMMGVGRAQIAFQPVAFPDLVPEPTITPTSVQFRRTSGGRPGVPAPRRVHGRPFLQWRGPTVWTTLALTINADGTTAGELAGASTFPRHWVYDSTNALTAKSGLIDFEEWYRGSYGTHSPWGEEDSPAVVAIAETALERELSVDDHARGPAPDDGHTGGDRHARRAGPTRHRAVPAARRGDRRRGRRRHQSPRSALAQSSGNGRRSKVASGRRRCGRSPTVAWPRPMRPSSIRSSSTSSPLDIVVSSPTRRLRNGVPRRRSRAT